jgi:hypothetical protein
MSAVALPAQADRKVTLVWILAIWAFALFGFGADFGRLATRRNRAEHSRFMVLAALALADRGLARNAFATKQTLPVGHEGGLILHREALP